jgi:hypothetical protein
MGRASSSKKVARAAKAAGRPGTSKSLVWPVSIGAVVLLGIALIAVSAAGRDSASAAPILGDHWHAAYGVYVCDEFVPPFNDAKADESGIHAHGDGLMHIHPFSTRYTGEDATIGAFGETTAFELADDSLTLPTGKTYENGDDCGGEPGVVQVKVWDGLADEEGRVLESGFADHAPQDGELVTIAFAPEGTDLETPPSAGTQPTDVAPAPGDPAPPGAPSTLPADGAEGGATEDGATEDGATEDGAIEGETTDTSADGSETTTTGP